MTKVEVYSKALNTSIEVSRMIGEKKGKEKGPTLIFMGGIHGNEPAGVFALCKVISQLNPERLRGNIYAISGNLHALRKGERYTTEDLNRLWTKSRMLRLPATKEDAANEDVAEQIEINAIIEQILEDDDGPFYFFDIHTTSSETLPFLTVNDSLLNRAFTSQYPLPTILGIEEYLDGPILSYINELGYVAFGFEAGQHDGMASIENCIDFIYLSLIYTGAMDKSEIDYHRCHDRLAKTTGDIKYTYEIYFRYQIRENEAFSMQPGFYNFQSIRKNQHLANSNGNPILSRGKGRIFMPLYQSKGTDGFFTIRRIKRIFLRLSAFARKHRLDRMLAFLPGVKWIDEKKSILQVNKRIARFMAKDIFHLFGYRSVTVDKYHYQMYNREAAARNEEYIREPWFS
ncbi:MAG: succinylglutamate desuccinylase/aspartoacylase family protein [Ekhidna sp.]|uniref:succinylglutamate desuccinylase/aspartoacylase family protein n=1 Tax=Ekhidna sp. TaxID=2608089 RepID=UPI0032EED02D